MIFPGLPFETGLPLVGSLLCFAFGAFVWSRATRRTANILFLALCVALAYWLFGAFQMRVHAAHAELALSWNRFAYIGLVFLPALMLHLTLELTKNRSERLLLGFAYASGAVFLALSRTQYFLQGFNDFSAASHGRAEAGFHLFLAAAALIVSLTLYNLGRAIQAAKTAQKRSGLALAAIALAQLVLIGSMWALPAYDINPGYPFSYFAAFFFVMLMAIAMARYGFMAPGEIVTETFVFLVGAFFIATMIFASDLGEMLFLIVFFQILVYFGSESLQALHLVVKQREQLNTVNKRLESANLQLQDVDRAKSRFVTFASHQLRAPLSGLRGYLDLLLAGDFGPLVPKQREVVQTNLEAVTRMISTVETYLDVSKIELGKLELYRTQVSLADLASRAVTDFVPLAAKNRLTIDVRIPATLPPVFCDSEKIFHVLVNLIDNAIKYTESGGIEISASTRDGRATIRIRDTGIGLTPDERAKLFSLFMRGDAAVKSGASGSGIGLYLFKHIVNAHGGDVIVESDGRGKGAVFGFTLPLSKK